MKIIFILFFILLFLIIGIVSIAQTNTFEIRPLKFAWVQNDDGLNDLCAHGSLYLRIGDEILSEQKVREWTLSAAALYLLRSVKQDYDPGQEENFIVPCCGIPYASNDGVYLMGCNKGIEWKIIHEGDSVRHITEKGTEIVLPIGDYKKIVFAFADEVEQFYKKSKPKDLSDKTDAEAWEAMWKEWKELRKL